MRLLNSLVRFIVCVALAWFASCLYRNLLFCEADRMDLFFQLMPIDKSFALSDPWFLKRMYIWQVAVEHQTSWLDLSFHYGIAFLFQLVTLAGIVGGGLSLNTSRVKQISTARTAILTLLAAPILAAGLVYVPSLLYYLTHLSGTYDMETLAFLFSVIWVLLVFAYLSITFLIPLLIHLSLLFVTLNAPYCLEGWLTILIVIASLSIAIFLYLLLCRWCDSRRSRQNLEKVAQHT